MKRIYTFAFVLILASQSWAQLTLIVDQIPENTPVADNIYVAGTFNGWDPGDNEFILVQNGDEYVIVLDSVAEGTAIEYKFTRGDWGKVEKGPLGQEIENRSYTYGNGDTVYHQVANWADLIGGGQSTAAENVIILDENFLMPQLDRTRRVWLYLPPGYDESDDRYPVLYMHDGQNLFDAATSFLGEWQVDESLNELAAQGYRVPIVVGIDNGGSFRIEEYTPWAHPQHGGGSGELYARFIVETLKPFIDDNYRTLAGPEYTGIMGSSLGGLISHFGVLEHQDVFFKAGVFSPSYWFSDSVWMFTRSTGGHADLKIYQMCGTLEGSSTMINVTRMNDSLLHYGCVEEGLFVKFVPGGEHNEALWAGEFAEAYLWLFSDYASVEEPMPGSTEWFVYPNPVDDVLTLPDGLPGNLDSVEVISMSGERMPLNQLKGAKRIPVSHLSPAIYLLVAVKEGKIYASKFIKN